MTTTPASVTAAHDFLQRIAHQPARYILSTMHMTAEAVATARNEGRMFVDDDGCGFVIELLHPMIEHALGPMATPQPSPTAPAAEAVQPNEWREAVIDALVIHFALDEKTSTDPRAAVAAIAAITAQQALDPAISAEARALIEQGREQPPDHITLNGARYIRVDNLAGATGGTEAGQSASVIYKYLISTPEDRAAYAEAMAEMLGAPPRSGAAPEAERRAADQVEAAIQSAVFGQFDRAGHKYSLITGPVTIVTAVLNAVRPYLAAPQPEPSPPAEDAVEREGAYEAWAASAWDVKPGYRSAFMAGYRAALAAAYPEQQTVPATIETAMLLHAAQQAEIERLRASASVARDAEEFQTTRAEAAESELSALRERVAGLEADAGRFRWVLDNLRSSAWREHDHALVGIMVPKQADTCACDATPQNFVRVIDAARTTGEPGVGK